MKIINFTKEHCEEAMRLARSDYEREREFVTELPLTASVPELTWFAENSLGVAAFEGDTMVGFLCSYPPIDKIFGSTDVRGQFSPMGAHAAGNENRAGIYEAMYQAAAKKWVLAGAVSHAIGLYAFDQEVLQMFFRNGFGMRCMDAIKRVEQHPIVSQEGFRYQELEAEERELAYPLDAMLNAHYRKSPFFMNRTLHTKERFLDLCAEENARIFVTLYEGQICAYLKITEEGETFLATGKKYRHITGAFCLPEFRGNKIMLNLLNFAETELAKSGIQTLGVDFETINPTAYYFWLKYFKAYTISVVRRIDERILMCTEDEY